MIEALAITLALLLAGIAMRSWCEQLIAGWSEWRELRAQRKKHRSRFTSGVSKPIYEAPAGPAVIMTRECIELRYDQSTNPMMVRTEADGDWCQLAPRSMYDSAEYTQDRYSEIVGLNPPFTGVPPNVEKDLALLELIQVLDQISRAKSINLPD